MVCEAAGYDDIQSNIDNDYVSINRGRNGIEYAWYADENTNEFVQVDNLQYVSFTEEEIEELFL